MGHGAFRGGGRGCAARRRAARRGTGGGTLLAFAAGDLRFQALDIGLQSLNDTKALLGEGEECGKPGAECGLREGVGTEFPEGSHASVGMHTLTESQRRVTRPLCIRERNRRSHQGAIYLPQLPSFGPGGGVRPEGGCVGRS